MCNVYKDPKNTKILLFTITYNHFLKINLTKLILKLYSK